MVHMSTKHVHNCAVKELGLHWGFIKYFEDKSFPVLEKNYDMTN